jgi:hypothetical protein
VELRNRWAWRYRDYLIRAFNSDVPFDQLVREHVAGDLLEKPRINGETDQRVDYRDHLLRLGEAGHDDCIKLHELSLDVVDNQIDTLGKAFQGLTLSCARCHNHKLDPIPTDDYYGCSSQQPRAVTHTMTRSPVEPELLKTKNSIRVELSRVWMSQADSLSPGAKKAAFEDPIFPGWLCGTRSRRTSPKCGRVSRPYIRTRRLPGRSSIVPTSQRTPI